MELSFHENQLKIFNSNSRGKAVCAGRGFGKSVLLLQTAIYKCVSYKGSFNPKSPKVAAIIMPSQVMGRIIHWNPLLGLLSDHPMVDHIDRTNLMVHWKSHTAPNLILRGADRNGDRLRGLNLLYAFLDEYQDFPSSAWNSVLFPALARNKDYEVLAIGTPKGRNNHFFNFCKNAYVSPDWQYFKYYSSDNPFFPKETLEQAERELPPNIFRQEHKASWENFEGQFFPSIRNSAFVKFIPSREYFRDIFIGVDFGGVNPYLAVVGLDKDDIWWVLDGWQNPATLDGKIINIPPVPPTVLVEECSRLALKWSVRRVYAPDDQPGLIVDLRNHGVKNSIPGLQRAVTVERTRPRPLERYSILDGLFYQNRLKIYSEIPRIEDSFRSFHRKKDSNGLMLNEPANGQFDHPIDAVGHVVATLEFKKL